ncbi:MAG: putative peptidoglycan glycosyltransferase FtsW [Symbiobacterium sp.]|uniref:FtsW/RodA/SpoVE family cell cycle protein n=1 Tax=Symbiobacterium sp. TaxID=1971213 RepID=UPI003463AC8C
MARALRSAGGRPAQPPAARGQAARRQAGRTAPGRGAPVLLPGAPDGLLIAAVLGLVSFGMVMIYSVTIHQGTSTEVVRKMAIQFGGGAVGLLAGMLVPLSWWRKLTVPLLVGSIAALGSLLVPGNPLAVSGLGATRWLGVGPLTVQPSEFAKLAFILFGAAFLDRWGARLGLERLATYLGVLGVMAGLIYQEPDLGTALVLGGVALCLLWVARVHWIKIAAVVALAGCAVYFLASNKEHQKERLDAWWNPWVYEDTSGHQVIQSWTAMARGGIWGVGLGESLQKLDDRLPEAETDFIFSIVVEELGLVGGAVVILLFVLFTWRGFTIALGAPDRYTMLLAAGVTSWVGGQAFLNLGVVTGTLPNTGIPLPFLSSGGSSLLALMTGVGILLSVSRLCNSPNAVRS